MKFEELFEDVTKLGVKIPQSEYLTKGKYPIFDQGQEYIAGFTDKEEGAYTDVPAYIFGDHTRIIKYVEKPCFLGADGVKLLRCRDYKVNSKYAYYALSAVKIPNTGYNRHFKWLKESIFHLPDFKEQERIVMQLNLTSELIKRRKKQLAKLDELVKSRFIEMFGDPNCNPKNWNIVDLKEIVANKVTNGFFAKREEYRNDGNVKVLGVANIVNRMYSNTNNLPRTNATESDIQKYSVKYGDMLFCRSSLVVEGIGKASIVPKITSGPILFECHVIRLPLDLKKCIPEFIQELSTTYFFRKQIVSQSKTSTMTTIGQEVILKSKIILPPLGLQKDFLYFIEQTNKLRVVINQSLTQLELLKKSLMQQYFG